MGWTNDQKFWSTPWVFNHPTLTGNLPLQSQRPINLASWACHLEKGIDLKCLEGKYRNQHPSFPYLPPLWLSGSLHFFFLWWEKQKSRKKTNFCWDKYVQKCATKASHSFWYVKRHFAVWWAGLRLWIYRILCSFSNSVWWQETWGYLLHWFHNMYLQLGRW